MAELYLETTGDVNIREKGKSLDVAPKGAILTTTGNRWWEVELEGGEIALVSGRVVQPYFGPVAAEVGPLVLPKEPPWLVIARGELGVKEVIGNKDNPRIVAYHQTCTLKATDDETPWCSAFVNWCITQAGLIGTNSAAAISWLKWGREIPLEDAQAGDIAIFSRSGGNHVTFHLSHDESSLDGLGGNQSDEVNIASQSLTRLRGIRRPF